MPPPTEGALKTPFCCDVTFINGSCVGVARDWNAADDLLGPCTRFERL